MESVVMPDDSNLVFITKNNNNNYSFNYRIWHLNLHTYQLREIVTTTTNNKNNNPSIIANRSCVNLLYFRESSLLCLMGTKTKSIQNGYLNPLSSLLLIYYKY